MGQRQRHDGPGVVHHAMNRGIGNRLGYQARAWYPEARYELGRAHAAAGRQREALDAFLELVRRDRSWRGDAGRKAMLEVFHLLGPGNALAGEYRRQLTIYL